MKRFKLLVAYHLFSVFWAFEAQMPKNVIHQMHQVLIEQKPFLEYWGVCFRVHTPRNNCIQVISGWEMEGERDTYTLTSRFKSSSTSFVHLKCFAPRSRCLSDPDDSKFIESSANSALIRLAVFQIRILQIDYSWPEIKIVVDLIVWLCHGLHDVIVQQYKVGRLYGTFFVRFASAPVSKCVN